MGAKTNSSINLPQRITLNITTHQDMFKGDLTRNLIFKNFAGNEIKLPVTLNTDKVNRKHLFITDFPETTHNLQVLGSMNHRSFWDKIYLKGGPSPIDIHTISLTVHYVNGPDGSIRDIPLLDNYPLNQDLVPGGEIFLTPHIESSVMAWAGIREDDHPIAVMIAKDLGKSGTSAEGFDQWGDNPKYRGWLGFECSEFVSWYMHAAYVRTGNYGGFPLNSFKNITYTQEIHDIFKAKQRSFFYHNGRRQFLNEFTTNVPYTPKAGDILIRR